MKYCLIIPFLLAVTQTFSQRNSTSSFIDVVTTDYLTDIEDYVFNDRKEILYLIEQDFNDDGRKDVMISGYYKGAWGNAGGEWDVYYQLDSGFKKCERIMFMYPDAAGYDASKNQIVLYSRMGCCQGSVVTVKLSDCNASIVDSKDFQEETGDLVAEEISPYFTNLIKFDQRLGLTNNKEVIEWK